jgi:hypothetical protein
MLVFDFPFFISSVIKVLRTHTHTHTYTNIYAHSGLLLAQYARFHMIPSHTRALLRFTISN